MQSWQIFLQAFENYNLDIYYDQSCPLICDQTGNRFRINFEEPSYKKKKKGVRSEIIGRALGGLKKGHRVLDLSAGLAVDAVFLAQLGFQVTSIERNPVIYKALEAAYQCFTGSYKNQLEFIYDHAENFLLNRNNNFDLCYFDPMFPSKKKSALPKQEMAFFKKLVGADLDADQILIQAIKSEKFKRVVVKRPIEANDLGLGLVIKSGTIEGKIIRYDIYAN